MATTGHLFTCCLPVSSEVTIKITVCAAPLSHPCPNRPRESFKRTKCPTLCFEQFLSHVWLKNKKKAYIWKNPLRKTIMCIKGRHVSYFTSVPCTGVSWDGTLKPANCAFPLMDDSTEIQTPWQTEQRARMSEHTTTRSEKSGVQTVIFQPTVMWLLPC